MEKRQLTCIGCPLGCQITVTMENGEVKDVAGYTCARGEKYAREEVTNPTRTVTTIVRVDGGNLAAVSVKTKDVIPKAKIFDILEEIKPEHSWLPSGRYLFCRYCSETGKHRRIYARLDWRILCLLPMVLQSSKF